MVGAVWYLAITSVLSLLQHIVERWLARSERRSAVNQEAGKQSQSHQPAPSAPEVIHVPIS